MTGALKRSSIVLIGWGLWLGCLTAIQAAFHPRPFVAWFIHGLLGGASFACLVTGGAMFVTDVIRRPRAHPIDALVETSAATATLVSGLALALWGANFGLWAAFIGAGIALGGAGGMLREERARRRAIRWARQRRRAHQRASGAATGGVSGPSAGRVSPGEGRP
jgi:hypothetical protein